MSREAQKSENVLLNLVCNIVLPTIILINFSTEKRLGPVWGLIIALAFPVGYGTWDFFQRRKTNFVSILGFASVLLSGGLGLLKVGGLGFAIKDAAVPCIIGLGVLLSMGTKRPLVKTLLFNDQIIDVARVEQALKERSATSAFDRLLKNASYGLALSFILSGTCNFFLARYLLKSPPGTPEFNAELGKMHFWNIPVILVPSAVMMMVILWKLIGGIERLTGLSSEEVFRGEAKKEVPGKVG